MGLFTGRKKRTWATPEELVRSRQLQLADQRQKELDEFKANAPQYEANLVNQARRQYADTLRSNVGMLNSNANHSGMLYSGRRAMGENDLRAGNALGLASEKDAIGKRLRDQIGNTQNDITNLRYGILTNAAQDQMNSDLQGFMGSQAQNQQIGGIMQGAGYAAGSMKGRSGGTTTSQPTSSPQYLSNGQYQFGGYGSYGG